MKGLFLKQFDQKVGSLEYMFSLSYCLYYEGSQQKETKTRIHNVRLLAEFRRFLNRVPRVRLMPGAPFLYFSFLQETVACQPSLITAAIRKDKISYI